MNNYIGYKPGLSKIIHHLDHLAKIEKKEICGPIHISVFPNNFCQLNCEYCCFKDTERNNTELSYYDFCYAIDILKKYGLKAVELSGGGDPLLWSEFDASVRYAFGQGLKLSLVTNGLALKDISKETLSMFNWIRPSVQSLAYAEKIALDHIPDNVKKSMSFIVYDEKTLGGIKKLYFFAKQRNIIIRVAPMRPCGEKWETAVETEVKKYGAPLIFFKKEAGVPAGCYMLWLRAAIDWNGNFLPCPSIELSPEHYGSIPDNFAVCKISEIEDWLINNPPHDLGHRCSFCNCGKDSNDFIHSLLEEVEDVDFV